jgi:hypothetical protein
MQIKNRKAFILLNNVLCHPEMELSNVKLVFLSPNTTAGMQPLDSRIIQNFKVKYHKMLLEFLLSHEDMTTLADAIKKVNVGDAIDWVFQSWDQVIASTIKNCFRKASLNEDVVESKHDDQLVQDQEKMFHHARVVGIEVEEETIIEDIPTFDTLDDGWEEAILSTPQAKLEIEEEEAKILLPKPTVTEVLKALQILSNFIAVEQLDEVTPLLSQMCKHLVKHRMQTSKTVTIDRFFHKTQ